MFKLEGGITITGTLVPSDGRDTYPLMDIKYVKGANYTVATYDEMIAIPDGRRSENMEITVAETNDIYRYVNSEWTLIGKAGGSNTSNGDSTLANINTEELVHRSELDELDVAQFETKLEKIVEDGKTVINQAVKENKDQLLSISQFDTFDLDTYRTEIETIINNSKKELITMDRLAEFDPNAFKAEVDVYINNAKKDILTLDKFDTFDPDMFKDEIQKLIDTGKKELITMDKLVELDIEQLKAEIKASILAELGRG